MTISPPNVLVIPITDSCDGRCQMCGIWRTPKREPASTELLRKIFAEPFFASGLTYINVTGGEPLKHPDLPGLADLFNQTCPGLREVSTNVSGLNPIELEQITPFRRTLREDVFLNVTVSLDGIGATHDRIRGVKEAWSNTLQSINRACELAAEHEKMAVMINYTISQGNHTADAIGPVVRFANDLKIQFALTYGAANDLYLRNDDSQRARFLLTDEQRVELAYYLDDLQEGAEFPPTQLHFFRMLNGMLRGQPRSSACVYQTRGIFLDLDGTVYPCGSAREHPYGRVPKESFETLYTGPNGVEIRRELRARVCPSCPTNSYYGLADGVWLDVLKEQRASCRGAAEASDG
jgi:MoaA/NifB/PqqE/SkfB family radical SAM enzyme